MRTLKTSEAAALLNVSPNTLRAWEDRFAYPVPRRSGGNHRLYAYAEIMALREALEEGLSVSSAISVAQREFVADAQTLMIALSTFQPRRADEEMERSLALRSLDRTLEEVLIAALDNIRERKGPTSAAWAHALAWGTDWLLRARRLAPDGERRAGVLVGDASAPPLDPDRTYVLALEVCCAQVGIEVLSLPVTASRRLSEAIVAFDPDAVVIAGMRVRDDDVARWAYQVRAAAGSLPFCLYRRDVDRAVAAHREDVLGPLPVAARGQLAQLLGLYEASVDREDAAMTVLDDARHA
jgi:DNA-binding transcriptional MerR regulator